MGGGKAPSTTTPEPQSNARKVDDKAKDAVSEAQHVQQRVTQQALEAAGMADKTDDDDGLPELR